MDVDLFQNHLKNPECKASQTKADSSMDLGLHNEKMAALFIDQLVAHGVDTFYLAPGSRSTTLALTLARHPRACTHVHFDERGLAFCALGRAKATRKKVAIVVTSGTAVGNLLPAVMEASNDHVPLLLLTADRPQELRACSANQTTDQVKVFADFVRWQADLPFSDPRFLPAYFVTAIAQALFLSEWPTPGPVHFNCMFRKPLSSPTPIFGISPSYQIENPIHPRFCQKGELIPPLEILETWAKQLAYKKGLLIVGSQSHDTKLTPLLVLAEKLGWPIYADILSQLRSYDHPHLIHYFDLLIQSDYFQDIEAVIHFGGRTVSKNVSEWLKYQKPAIYLHICDYPTLIDPHYIVTHRLHASSSLCAEKLSELIDSLHHREWLDFWRRGNQITQKNLTHFFSSQSPSSLCEPLIARKLTAHAPPLTPFFISNSMPIRDADKFLSPSNTPFLFFANRGVSGIDGNIATAIGIAQGIRKPLIALLGDLAFLHDMNSLALLRDAAFPLCLIVINNGGGAIFSFLPIHEKKESIDCEKFFAAAHSYSFSPIATLFDISYALITSEQDLDDQLAAFYKTARSILIEIPTDREENLQVHGAITNHLRSGLSSSEVFTRK